MRKEGSLIIVARSGREGLDGKAIGLGPSSPDNANRTGPYMPRCAVSQASTIAAQCARQRAAAEQQRRRDERRGNYGSSDDAGGYGSEEARPAPVAVPPDAPSNWAGGDGANHASPGLGVRRRRAGAGPSFTPIREDSKQSTSRSGLTPRGPIVTALWRFLGHASTIANSVILQTALYVSYVAIFQLLTETLRLKEEYHFDKLIADTFIDNYFDSAHNTFQSMRRPADFYEWGNNVLIPGLFSNAGPCAREVGAAGHFSSATSRSAPTDVAGAMLAKGCNDDAWPDGGGSFHLESATAWSVGEVLENLDVLDWSDGLIIKQARVSPLSAQHCATKLFAALPAGDRNSPPPAVLAVLVVLVVLVVGDGGGGAGCGHRGRLRGQPRHALVRL